MNQETQPEVAEKSNEVEKDTAKAVTTHKEVPVLPRRSARANKGQTTKYKDYHLHHMLASASKMPITKEIDTKGEDLTDIDDEAEDHDLLFAGKVRTCAVETHEFQSAAKQKVNAKGLTVKAQSEK